MNGQIRYEFGENTYKINLFVGFIWVSESDNTEIEGFNNNKKRDHIQQIDFDQNIEALYKRKKKRYNPLLQ